LKDFLTSLAEALGAPGAGIFGFGISGFYLILNARKKNMKSLKTVVKIIIQFIMKTSTML
jgi:hypothetical protein